MRTILLAAVAAIAISGPASAFTARNGMRVDAGAGTSFEVRWSGISRKSAFWCAAGDYATQVLKVPPATRIYRVSPGPRRAGEGIRFDLDATRAVPSGFIRLQGGFGLTAAHARLYCDRGRDAW